MRLAPAQAVPGGRGCARALRGPGRAESMQAPAEGGGAVALESSAPSGRGRDAGCWWWGRRGCDGRPLASPAVLGPVGRWATRSRAEEAVRPPHGESRGRSGSRGRSRGGASDRGCSGRGARFGAQARASRIRQWRSLVSCSPELPPEPPSAA